MAFTPVFRNRTPKKLSLMFISCLAKKRTIPKAFGRRPKTMLPPTLIKGNIYGKRVAFKRLPAKSPPKCLKPKRKRFCS